MIGTVLTCNEVHDMTVRLHDGKVIDYSYPHDPTTCVVCESNCRSGSLIVIPTNPNRPNPEFVQESR